LALGCWRWFKAILKEASITVTPQNKAKIEKAIHEHIGEHAEYERCSAAWVAMGKKVKMNSREKKRLIEALKVAIK